MKKLLIGGLAALVVGGTFISCNDSKIDTSIEQNNEINISECLAKMESEIEMMKPVEVSEEDLKNVYGVNVENINDFSMKTAAIMPGIDTLGIFEAKDGKVEDVKADMQKILDKKKADAYTPTLMDALDNAKVVVNGNYVGIFILQSDPEAEELNSDKAEVMFNAFFE